jgi:hypothetical protein
VRPPFGASGAYTAASEPYAAVDPAAGHFVESGAATRWPALCEAFGKACYDLQSGNYASGRLTYHYNFDSRRMRR